MSFRDSISDRPATIKVGRGPHAGVFTVQKALLCNSSTYFEAALNGPFIEGQTQTINLDDEDPTIFRTYVAWLYQGQLNSQDIERALEDPQDFGQHIAELIVFADKRVVRELKNDAISMLLSYLYRNGLAALDVINCIYGMPRTREVTHLRWLLANEEVWHGQRLEKNIKHWKSEFLAEIIRIYKSFEGRSCVRVLCDKSFEPGEMNVCRLVHSHIHRAQNCSSLNKNAYTPAPPPTHEPPNKKRRTGSRMPFVEVLED
ncbi:hypothetical protein E4T48_02922 [Aureobasidium sp. EXF-10727]|nr:hypothetical protein E4T48_02922 [Aureobasidium sp. EXF-10727]